MDDQTIWVLQPMEFGRSPKHLRTCAQAEGIWNKRIRKDRLILVCGRTLQLADVKNKTKQVTNTIFEYDQVCIQYLSQVKYKDALYSLAFPSLSQFS